MQKDALMIYRLKKSMWMGIVVTSMAACSCLAAGDFVAAATGAAGEEQHDQSWAREQKTAPKQEARTIIQQKAQVRAEQRQARLASMNWYGMSNSRPTASPTPFTSRYSPLWEMPGGMPYSWHPEYTYNNRTSYLYYWR